MLQSRESSKMGVTDISKATSPQDLADRVEKLSPKEQTVVKAVLNATIAEDEAEINLQPKSKADFEQSIRLAQARVLREKSKLKIAKDMLKDEVEGLDAFADYEDAKHAAAEAKSELEAAKIESGQVEHAQIAVDDAVANVGAAQQMISDLLVVYSAKFNSRTVNADQNRLILMTAKLGKVEPEQLSIF